MKTLVRAGVPGKYRSMLWKLAVYAKVKDLKETKGPHYFNSLRTNILDFQVKYKTVTDIQTF